MNRVYYKLIACAIVIILLLNYPAQVAASCSLAFSVWATSVLPAMFPFMVLCNLLSNMGAYNLFKCNIMHIFKLPSNSFALLLAGAVSGYPSGAKLLGSMNQASGSTMDDGSMLRILVLCNIAGPMYIMSTVSLIILNMPQMGARIYFSQLLSGIILALIMATFSKPCAKLTTPEPTHAPNILAALPNCVFDACMTLIKIGGMMALFYSVFALLNATKASQIIVTLLSTLGVNPKIALAFIPTTLEMTLGSTAIFDATGSTLISAALCTFAVTFGGGCIAMQATAFCNINTLKYMLTKFLQGILAALIFTLLTV